jgi:hypothetical protein
VFQTWVSEMGGSGWMPIQGQSDLLARDGAGANQIRWPTACDGTSAAGKEITDADVLAVNPLIPSQIAYANCRETTNDGSCVVDWTTAYDVIDSGASPGSAADDVTYHSLADPNAQCLQDASTRIGDIDFSPDATHMVEVHRGASGAGIYSYAASQNGGASANELLAIPNGWTFYGVRYIGPGRIGFTAGTSSDTIGLYTIATTCTPATCNVAAGTGVTNLTGSNYVSEDYVLGTAGFSYTSSGSAITAAATPPPPPPPCCTPPPCTTCHQTSKLTATVARIRTQHLATLVRRGLTITASCSGACVLKATLMLKRAVLGTVSQSLRGRGRTKLVLHLSRPGRAKLKHVHNPKLTLTLVASDRAGHRRTLTQTFKLTK